jgi:hypothetical protein
MVCYTWQKRHRRYNGCRMIGKLPYYLSKISVRITQPYSILKSGGTNSGHRNFQFIYKNPHFIRPIPPFGHSRFTIKLQLRIFAEQLSIV